MSELEKPKEELKSLSASLLKTLESCSWLYYTTYVLKLPRSENDGSRKGSCCHSIFELLLNPKHKEKYDKIVKAGTINVIPALERLLKIYCKKNNLEVNAKNLLHIDEMILVGLRTEFFIEGGTLIAPEYKFDIINENPKYRIKGFMDKPYLLGDKIIIDDFKSSKKKYEGEEKVSNVQGLSYSLAAKKIWPDKKPVIQFIFLQYPEDPKIELEFDDDTLKGFEHYLAYMQDRVENFTEKDAKSSLAYDKGMPTDGSFSGCLMCGRTREPGELKKDGTPKWECGVKWPFDYYIIKKDGKFKKSTFDANIPLKDGETIEKAHYKGCSKFNKN